MGLPPLLFGTLREHYLLLFGAASGFALGAGLLGAWLGARFATRAALRRGATDTVADVATRADVAALSDEFQALLIEVERIVEGQRFVAKVLADRADGGTFPPPRPRREPGSITPH